MLIVFIKRYKKAAQLLSPASLYTLFWGFFALMGVIFDDGVYSYAGIYWILASILAVNVGQMIILPNRQSKIDKTVYVIELKTKLHLYIVGFISCVLIAFTLKDYIASGGVNNVPQVAYDYYTNQTADSSLLTKLKEQLFSISMYFNGYLGGELFFMSKEKTKERLVALLPIIPPVISMFTTSGKLGVLVVGIFFVIGYIMMANNVGYIKTVMINKKVVKRYWILIPILAVFFALSLSLRMGGTSKEYLSIAFNKLKSYAFGSPMAFNAWFAMDGESEYTMGLQTFMGIPHALGLIDRKMGVYQELIETSVWHTNVYTAFRGLILDFGKVGALVVLIIFGMCAGKAFSVYKNRKTNLSFCVLSMSYLFIMYSIIISPYIYFNLSIICFGIMILRMVGYKFINLKEQIIESLPLKANQVYDNKEVKLI